MSRWIDADVLIAKLKEYNPQTSKVKVAQIVVNNLPSIDIVRCSECAYADKYYHCNYMTTWNTADDFCSYGERRE